MHVRVYTGHDPVHNMVLRAFFDGCKAKEKHLVPFEEYQPSDVAVVFGTFKKDIPASWRRGVVIEEQKKRKKPVVILDSGYVKRGSGVNAYYACGLNGLNGHADFKNKNMPPDRWQALGVPLLPWRKTGSHVVLCGQVPWDASVQHIDMIAWLHETAKLIRQNTDREIVYRPHPLAVKQSPARLPGCRTSVVALKEDLNNAWAVVTYNSNTGVDAILHGIPNFCLGTGSMTYGVSSRDLGLLERPFLPPHREQWAYNLAFTQWRPDEMAAAWEHLFS